MNTFPVISVSGLSLGRLRAHRHGRLAALKMAPPAFLPCHAQDGVSLPASPKMAAEEELWRGRAAGWLRAAALVSLSQPAAVWAPRSPGLPHIGTRPAGVRGGRAEHRLEGGNCIKVTLLERVCAQKVAFFNQENKTSVIFALSME